jgi:LysM repeat protein
MNPEFLRGVTYSPYDSVMVRLPRGSAGVAATLGTLRQEARLPDAIEHRVKRGETLGLIAGKYQTTVAEILALPENSGVRAKRLRAGQIVQIPVAPAKHGSPPLAPPVKISAPDNLIAYTVQPGQSLSQIARLLGVSVDELCAWNRIRDRDIVQPGQKLVVHVSAPSVEVSDSNNTAPLFHTVRRGETVSKIAARYGRQPAEILRWNNLSGGDLIYPGQKLRLQPE